MIDRGSDSKLYTSGFIKIHTYSFTIGHCRNGIKHDWAAPTSHLNVFARTVEGAGSRHAKQQHHTKESEANVHSGVLQFFLYRMEKKKGGREGGRERGGGWSGK